MNGRGRGATPQCEENRCSSARLEVANESANANVSENPHVSVSVMPHEQG